jgi:hypothetical protein
MMEHKPLSQIKQHIKIVWHKKYVSYETKKKCEIITTNLCGVTLVSGCLILFIMGGSIYAEEHPKELTYTQDTCQVYTNGYRQFWCQRRDDRRRCYAAVWNVVYAENQTINSTIVGYNRYNSVLDATKKAHEYQVTYFKQYLINLNNYEIISRFF